MAQLEIPNWFAVLGLRIQGDLGPWTCYQSRAQGLVIFTKSPPLTPASILQRRQRNRLALAALAWRMLPQPSRAAWSSAARRCTLRCTGYNLWCAAYIKPPATWLATIERQSGIPLPNKPLST